MCVCVRVCVCVCVCVCMNVCVRAIFYYKVSLIAALGHCCFLFAVLFIREGLCTRSSINSSINSSSAIGVVGRSSISSSNSSSSCSCCCCCDSILIVHPLMASCYQMPPIPEPASRIALLVLLVEVVLAVVTVAVVTVVVVAVVIVF